VKKQTAEARLHLLVMEACRTGELVLSGESSAVDEKPGLVSRRTWARRNGGTTQAIKSRALKS